MFHNRVMAVTGGASRGRLALAAVVAFALLAAGAVAVRAQGFGAKEALRPTVFFDFCREAQKTVAGITSLDGVTITNTAYAELGQADSLTERTFVKSKSTIVQPTVSGGEVTTPGRIEVRQFVEWTAPGSGRPENIRCKMRTAESLVRSDPTWGFGTRVQTSGAAEQSACRRVNEDTLAAVQAELAADGVAPAFAPGDITFLDDVWNTTGAGWAYGSGTVLKRSGSQLTVQSGAVYSPSTTPGLPANFVAAHYCTFVAPTYLSDVLRGSVTLP